MVYVVVVSGEEGGNPAIEALMNSGNYLMESSVCVPHPPAFSGSVWGSFVQLIRLAFRRPFFQQSFITQRILPVLYRAIW